MTSHSNPGDEPRDDRPSTGGANQPDEQGFAAGPPPVPQWAQEPDRPQDAVPPPPSYDPGAPPPFGTPAPNLLPDAPPPPPFAGETAPQQPPADGPSPFGAPGSFLPPDPATPQPPPPAPSETPADLPPPPTDQTRTDTPALWGAPPPAPDQTVADIPPPADATAPDAPPPQQPPADVPEVPPSQPPSPLVPPQFQQQQYVPPPTPQPPVPQPQQPQPPALQPAESELGRGRQPVQQPYEPWRIERPARRGPRIPKGLVIGLAGATGVAVVAAAGAFVLFGGDGENDPTAQISKIADKEFAGADNAVSDGRTQVVTSAAASGDTVVAVGAETGPGHARGQFLVSTDGGRTFRPGTAREPDGGDPAPGMLPQQVTASSTGWVALGSRPGGVALWTSQDGHTWQRQQLGPSFGPNDHVTALTSGRQGLVAVGYTGAKPDRSDAEPVLWTSRDGRTWQRQDARALKFNDEGGALHLTHVATDGKTTLVQGVILKKAGGRLQPGRRVWRSDDWRTWEPGKVPVPKGNAGMLIGGGPTGLLVARDVRRGGQTYAQVYRYDDGKWREAGRIQTPGQTRVLRMLAGEQGHVAVVGTQQQGMVLQSSGDGESWRDVGTLPLDTITQVLGGTVTSRQTVVTGAKTMGEDVDAVIAVRDAQGGEVSVDLSAVEGLQRPDRAVTAVTVAGDRTVAVGGADGDASVWTSADGRSWKRAQGQGAVLARRGIQRLTDVTHGGRGWLAVGFDNGQGRRPLVVTSADGNTWQAVDGDEAFRPGRRPLSTNAAAAGPGGYVIVGEEGSSAAAWFSADLRTWERAKGAGDEDLESDGGMSMLSVTAAGNGFVAVGSLNDPNADGGSPVRPALWTSADGRTWSLQRPELPQGFRDGRLTHVRANGNTLVAFGAGTGSNGQTPLAYASADGGRTWEPVALPTGDKPAAPTAVTATDNGFAATIANGRPGTADVALWTSRDGKAWRAETVEGEGLTGAGDQRILGLAGLRGGLLGVGITSDAKSDHPVLWVLP